MIRKDRIKTAKTTVRTVIYSKTSISRKVKFGQKLDTNWPVEDEYFFEAEDY